MNTQTTFSPREAIQYFETVLAEELAGSLPGVPVRYTWQDPGQIGSLSHFPIRLTVNLNAMKSAWTEKRYFSISNIHFCACFIAAYLRYAVWIWEPVPQDSVPDTYFAGLAMLNILSDCRSRKKIQLFSPAMAERKRIKHLYLRPAEIFCSLQALHRCRDTLTSVMTPEERRQLDCSLRTMTLYSSLPEIAYRHSVCPAHALFRELQPPEDTDPFSGAFTSITGLTPAAFANGSLEDLLAVHLRTGRLFPLEIALRLVCYSNGAASIPENPQYLQCLRKAADAYRTESIAYFRAYPGLHSRLLNDNFTAIKKTVQKINLYIPKDPLQAAAGSLHMPE